MPIRAISLDLDDTLWPIEPVMLGAERHLHAWLELNCPDVASAYPIPVMRELREKAFTDHPHLAHDFSALRKVVLRSAFAGFGLGEPWVERAFGEFSVARNTVKCYADALPALQRLAAMAPLVSISNGTADLELIGIHHFFRFAVSARECGVAKPHPDIFHSACARLGLEPESVLHVGDDAELDVAGARAAGLRTAWINRTGAVWPAEQQPDLIIHDLDELADWMENHISETDSAPVS